MCSYDREHEQKRERTPDAVALVLPLTTHDRTMLLQPMPNNEPLNDPSVIRRQSTTDPHEHTGVFRRHLSTLAALFTLGSATIHITLIPIRAQEYLPYGLFLVAVALVQLGVAIALVLRPSRQLAMFGTLIGVGLIAAIIAFQRTALPIGPHPWQPVGLNDADLTGIGTGLFATLILLLLAWHPLQRGKPPRRFNVACIPAVVVTLVLTFVGVASAINATPVGMQMSAPVPAGHAAIPMNRLHTPPGNQPVRSFTLVAEPRKVNGHAMWTFNGTVPGPELRVTQGDRVRVTLVNHLPAATSIHWHGVAVPNAEDGAAGITQDAVPPGGSYAYEFVASDPGTYMYHSHQDTFHQLLRGLFGGLIVEPPAGIGADRDYAVVLHEMPSGSRYLRDTLGELIVGAPSNQVPAVNGITGDLHLAAQPGERVRLRLIGSVQADMHMRSIPDMMHAGPQELVLLGTTYEVVALDGHDLHGPQAIGPERLRVAIGQRYDLTFTMPASGAVRLVDTSSNETVTVGSGPLPPTPNLGQLPVFDFTNYGAPAPDPVTANGRFDVSYQALLGNHFGFREGRLELVHTINGQDSPMGAQYVVRPGQVVRLHIENTTDEFHTMHLHGHSFSALTRNGQPLRGSPIRLDSLLVDPHDSWDIAFVADNPGLWMFHCHVLLHAEFGMSAMVVYQGVTTPYEIGSRSGNNPE
jgi:FtsP/CotA-like multicopper oxidase with cupredoxin domain